MCEFRWKFQLILLPETGPINNIPALVLIIEIPGLDMAWHRAGFKQLSNQIMTYFTEEYICHSASTISRTCLTLWWAFLPANTQRHHYIESHLSRGGVKKPGSGHGFVLALAVDSALLALYIRTSGYSFRALVITFSQHISEAHCSLQIEHVTLAATAGTTTGALSLKTSYLKFNYVAYSAPSHYLHQCWNIVNWTIRNKILWNFNQNTKLFIHENAFENIVCQMAAILSRGRWVDIFLSRFCIDTP